MVVQYTNLFDFAGISQEEKESMKIEDRKSKLGLLLYSFSFVSNIEKLFTVTHKGDQNLAVLNGVRVLSIGWVIVGHAFAFAQMVPFANFATIKDIFQGKLFGVIPGGVFAVDTFFLLSGLLTAYLLTLKMYPKKGKANFLLLYFHRYYRLIFPLLFVEGFYICLVKFLGDGPIYRTTMENLGAT